MKNDRDLSKLVWATAYATAYVAEHRELENLIKKHRGMLDSPIHEHMDAIARKAGDIAHHAVVGLREIGFIDDVAEDEEGSL